MATTITIRDELSAGGQADEWSLEFLTERVSVRELIRGRVYQEVVEQNAGRSGPVRRLVQPTDAERALNGRSVPTRPSLDWEQHYDRAVRAFQRNGFLLLIDDRQVDNLDEEIELRTDTRVTFLRLVPVAGG